jgi:hypothetical protein
LSNFGSQEQSMDYVINKATGEKIYGRPKFLQLLLKTGRFMVEGAKVELTPAETLRFINEKLKHLEELEEKIIKQKTKKA